MKRLTTLATIVTIASIQTLQASFLVEPRSGGKGYANFSWAGGSGGAPSASATVHGTAPGLTPNLGHIYGGSVSPDIYQFSYTPGRDLDNTVFTEGQYLGDNLGVTNLASGLLGGGSGLYNVYATWVASVNVGSPITSPNVDFILTSDGVELRPPSINQNNGYTGTPGGNGGWYLLGTVQLTAGNTYTVKMDAINDVFVSMRSAGVMWELAPVPEPSTLALGIVGGLLLLRMRRSR